MAAEEDGISCAVCNEIYSDPRCFPCGHSFCLKCITGLADKGKKFTCPICQFTVDLKDGQVDDLPKNFVICTVIEAKDRKQSSMCLKHQKLLDIYCDECNILICSKCLLLQHKSHNLVDVDDIFIKRNNEIAEFLDSTKLWASQIEVKKGIVEQSRYDLQRNVDSIQKSVDIIFKKWYDALHVQQQNILSCINEETDTRMKMYDEAERVLMSSMTEVTELENEIKRIQRQIKATVVQQYSSINARREECEREVLREIESCFEKPDDLKIEVCAPWIEEAIANIKIIDMKQTQACPQTQKISEIQEENTIQKRNTGEVKRLEYWNECLDSLVQNLRDHVVSGAEPTPEAIKQPAEIEPESSLAKRYQDVQGICEKFMKVKSDNKELKEKNLCLEILMAGLDTYLTSNRQTKDIIFDIPDQIKFDARFSLQCGKAQDIAKAVEADLSALNEKMKKKTKEHKQNFENLRAEHEKLKTDYKKLEKIFLEANVEKSRLGEDKRKLENSISYLKQEKANMDVQYKLKIESQIQEITQLRQDKESLLTRLSKIAGDRLTHDNVNIADLSDADRPTKLSEIYSELYDNEWRDAFEELTENMGFSDEAAITCLLEILMNAFCKCKQITWDRYESLKLVASTLDVKQENIPSQITMDAQEGILERKVCSKFAMSVGFSIKNKKDNDTQTDETMLKSIKATSLTSALSIDQEKSLKNIWRATSNALKDQSIKVLCADLMTSLGKPETEMPKTSKYLTVCTELCWKMGVQEKPMHLDIKAEKEIGHEKQFDTDKFRAYTKPGKSVDYVVWPALFLHESGAMLATGIAQGCQKRVSSKLSE